MDTQALLVRYCMRGLKKFEAVVTKRDRLAMLSGKRTAWSLFVLAFSLMATQVNAQPWPPLPAPHSSPPQEGFYGCQPGSGVYAELISEENFNPFAGGMPLHTAVAPHLPDSWIRLEYWHAKIGHRGGRSLGTSIGDINGNLIDNTSERFDLPSVDPNSTTGIAGAAVAPTTDNVDWDDNNGIKGSFGIPIDTRSWLEGSVWSLQEQAESLRVPSIPPTSLNDGFYGPPIQFIVIPYTIDNQPGNLGDVAVNTPPDGIPVPLIVYDESFFSEYSVNLWSADVNYVYDLRIPHDGWSLQSIVGWRHEEYSENLSFGGSFNNNSGYATDDVTITGPLTTPQSNRIESKVHNFRHALQFGFRSEVKQNRFTVGVEPKVALGVGLIRSRVNTENAREPGDLSVLLGDPNLVIDDPASTTSFDRELDFAPSAELNLYAKYDVTEWLKFKVGYNLTWMGRLGSADTSIRYNSISAADPTMSPSQLDFGVNQNVNSRYVSAFTVGGEIVFP